MDKKVLNLLIHRVLESSEMYTLHKNDAWKKCLDDDVERLENYCLKQSENNELPNKFKFKTNMEIIYTAIRIDSDSFLIKWSFFGDEKTLKYTEDSVRNYIKEGYWVLVD